MAAGSWGVRAVAPGVAFFLLAVFLGGSLPAAAQTAATPTPAQLEAFKTLPPDQQKAVLDAMAGASRGGSQPSQRAPAQQPRTESQVPIPLETPATPSDLGPPRIDGPVTLVLDVAVKEMETEDSNLAATLASRRDRILAGNPYRLDSEGGLILPFLPRMQLRGLTAEEAQARLNADPRLAGLEFKVSLLRIEPTGAERLKPFGYDVFRERQMAFAQGADVPVPANYAVGPGDTVLVELSGKRSGSYSLVVDREGRLHLPDFGPMPVAGLSFDRMRSQIEQRVAQEMIGVRATVSVGELRSIQVFVLGEVEHPGSYVVSSLTTVTNALLASGGITEVGSLRNIEVKRRGALLGRLDLYELLLKGDAAGDLRLQAGDAVFVPPVGITAGIDGRVRRPAIYEVRPGAKVADLLELSGGLAPDADGAVATLERISADHERIVLNVDLGTAAGRNLELRAGDVLTVPKVLDDLSRTVTLEGHVMRPGRYAWRDGMHLSDLLGSLQALKIGADQRYILIHREHLPDRRIELLSADAVAAFGNRGSAADPLLASRDRVIVFDMQRDRGSALADVLTELRLQTRDNDPVPVVSIYGRVRAPGQYPLERDMTVADLIRAGGGLDEAAYTAVAELTRFNVVNGEARETEVQELKLSEILARSSSADVPLKAYDKIVIKETPDWNEQGTVRLTGEVRFPGEYPIRKGETLSSVVMRAGGLTDHAFAEGAVFTRDEIKNQEREQLDSLARRLQNDLAVLALQGSQTANDKQNPQQALAVGQSLLTQLQSAKPTGRLVINLERALEHTGSDEDIQLRAGDNLIVPPLRQYVTVIGEAQNPTSHVWRHGLGRDDYLRMSGGTTNKADSKRIYVVRANGSVVMHSGSRWFSRSDVDMRPGDTIVVPLDTQKMRPLPLWTAVTTVIYNLAVAVAAIGSL
jgi:polysaccharide export outer membrane protein